MSKLDSLVSVMERAEKQALALFLDEGASVDNTILGVLGQVVKDKAEKQAILSKLKSIKVGNEKDAPTLYDYSDSPNQKGTGKNVIFLANWLVDAVKNGKDVQGVLNELGDLVRKKYVLKSVEKTPWEKLYKLCPAWEEIKRHIDSQFKIRGNIIKRGGLGDFDFPALEVYSDANVDCYKADTPEEAIELGDKYTFCISDKGGANQFFTYRFGKHPSWGAKQRTSCYFVWFKDKEGNKNHEDMIVLHVGENGNYMATESQNGLFPWISKRQLLEEYPVLKPALPYMPYKEPTKEEEIVNMFQGYEIMTVSRSKRDYTNVRNYTPDQLEKIIGMGIALGSDAFKYILSKIDGKDLVNGNNGNSLIKKYIEYGHNLVQEDIQLLRKLGYDKEVDRSRLMYWRRFLAENPRKNIYDVAQIRELCELDKWDFSNNNSLIKKLADEGRLELHNKFDKDEIQFIDKFRKDYPELYSRALYNYAKRILLGQNPMLDVNLPIIKWIYNDIDKGDTSKDDSLIKFYLNQDLEIPHEILKFLMEKGLSTEVEAYNKRRALGRYERYKAHESNYYEFIDEDDGTIILDKNPRSRSFQYIEWDVIPVKVKELRLVGRDRTDSLLIPVGKGCMVKQPKIDFKVGKLDIDLFGNSIADAEIDFSMVESEIGIRFDGTAPTLKGLPDFPDNVRDINIYSDRLANLEGLPEIKKGVNLYVSSISLKSLDGLKGSDFSLKLNMWHRGTHVDTKALPKKMRNLELVCCAYEDVTFPDEVSGLLQIEMPENKIIDKLPKKIGKIDMDWSKLEDVTVEECVIEEAPDLDKLKRVNSNVSGWLANHVKQASGESLKGVVDYAGYYLGDGQHTTWKGYENKYYVYPLVRSLKGMPEPLKDGGTGYWNYPVKLLIYNNSVIESLDGLPEGFKSVCIYNCPNLRDLSAALRSKTIQQIAVEDWRLFPKEQIKLARKEGKLFGVELGSFTLGGAPVLHPEKLDADEFDSNESLSLYSLSMALDNLMD